MHACAEASRRSDDPTFGVPDAAPRPASRFIGGEVLTAIGRFLSDAVPEPVKRLFHDLAGGLVVLRDRAVHPVPILAAVGTVAGLLLWRRRRRRSRRPGQPVALGAYLDLADALAPHGHPLVEHATPREYLRGVTKDPAIERAIVAEAEVVVATLERDRFSGRPAADADLRRAREAVTTVRQLVSNR